MQEDPIHASAEGHSSVLIIFARKIKVGFILASMCVFVHLELEVSVCSGLYGRRQNER